MPTLFDSHEEFNEWFSKDIESHAENKSAIDESQSTLVFISILFTVHFISKEVKICVRVEQFSKNKKKAGLKKPG